MWSKWNAEQGALYTAAFCCRPHSGITISDIQAFHVAVCIAKTVCAHAGINTSMHTQTHTQHLSRLGLGDHQVLQKYKKMGGIQGWNLKNSSVRIESGYKILMGCLE